MPVPHAHVTCFVVGVKVRTISMEEVAKHSSPEDCWVVLYGHFGRSESRHTGSYTHSHQIET